MPLPAFTHSGDLPEAIYRSTIHEVESRFGHDTPTRRNLYQRLQRAYELAMQTGFLKRFIVYGSFVTAKSEPNDVDIFMVMDDGFVVSGLNSEQAILFDHAEADFQLGMSVFWLGLPAILGTEDEAVEFWQGKRDGGRRGIVEIVEAIT